MSAFGTWSLVPALSIKQKYLAVWKLCSHIITVLALITFKGAKNCMVISDKKATPPAPSLHYWLWQHRKTKVVTCFSTTTLKLSLSPLTLTWLNTSDLMSTLKEIFSSSSLTISKTAGVELKSGKQVSDELAIKKILFPLQKSRIINFSSDLHTFKYFYFSFLLYAKKLSHCLLLTLHFETESNSLP